MEYLLILALVLLMTILVDWKTKIQLYESNKERLLIPLIFFAVGVVWDSYAVYRGHWQFSESGLSGLTIGFLPVEEYLFFLIIPYFILTFYKVFKIIID